MLRKIFNITALLMTITAMAMAQNLIYLDSNREIPVNANFIEATLYLSDADTAIGLQATLKISKSIITTDTIEPLYQNSLLRYFSPDSTTTNVVMLTNPGKELTPGKYAIAKVRFKVINPRVEDSVIVSLTNLILAGPNSKRLNAEAKNLTFRFVPTTAKKFELNFNLNYSSLVAYFKNIEPVKYIKVEITLNGNSPELISLMPRSAGVMNLSYTTADNILTIELTSKNNTYLEPGEGEIFFITGKFNSPNNIAVKNVQIKNSSDATITPDYKLILTDVNPTNYSLEQNYPNPFNPATTIKFTVPEQTAVHLAVFDISGRLVKVLADRVFPAGTHYVVWDGTDENGNRVSSGVYIYRIYTEKFTAMRKMILTK